MCPPGLQDYQACEEGAVAARKLCACNLHTPAALTVRGEIWYSFECHVPYRSQLQEQQLQEDWTVASLDGCFEEAKKNNVLRCMSNW